MRKYWFVKEKIAEYYLCVKFDKLIYFLNISDNLGTILSEYEENKSLFNSRSLEETARFILSTATSTSSSVTVNYFIPILLFSSKKKISFSRGIMFLSLSVPLLYFVFRLGLFNLDDALGMTSGLDLSGYNAPSAGYGAPSPSYGAPAPSYNAPAPSYNAPAPASNGAGLSSSNFVNSGAYLTSKDDDVVIFY